MGNRLKDIFNDIKNKVNIKLTLLYQLPLKQNCERQVKFICEDKEHKKYFLTASYSEISQYRLKKAYQNGTIAKEKWGEYFHFNLPFLYGEIKGANYTLSNYLESAQHLTNKNCDFENTLLEIDKKTKRKVQITDEFIKELIHNIIEERCFNDEQTRKKYLATQEFNAFIEEIKKYKELEISYAHCDFKPDNVLSYDNKYYLIDFAFGIIELPAGFDLYCLKRFKKENVDQDNYSDLHKLFWEIHHVGDNVDWLKSFRAEIELTDDFIKLQENNKETLIPIEKSPLKRFDLKINFKNIEISSCAISKIFNQLLKKYPHNSQYTVIIKNSPFLGGNLEYNSKNYTFSGILNKNNELKNFTEKLKSSQAFRCYSRILPYVKPYTFRAFLAFLLCIPIGSLDAVIALALKPYMDLVMVEKTISSPWYIPFGIVAFTVVQGILNYSAIYLNTWVGGKITNDLKIDLYKKMLSFGTGFFDKRKSGDIIFRFHTDADTACSGLLSNLKTFISRLFSSIALVGVLFYNSWQLALIAVVILFCAFAPLANIRKRIKSVLEKSVAATATVLTAYNETYNGNKTITSYNLKKFQEEKFIKILRDIFSLRIKLTQRTSWLSPMMHIIISIGIGLILGYGSHLILTKQITSGNFVSFISALLMLYTPLKNIGNNLNAVQFSFMAIERVFSLLDQQPAILDKEDAIKLEGLKNIIEFKDVSFEYIKNRPVLKNINLTAQKGETIAFVGNSGGGKTTIVNLIPRFYDVKSGSITIDGINIKDYTLESLRHNIAVVFQDNFLFSGTIKDNIMLGNENATEEDIQKVIKMAYLDNFIATLQDGLDTQIGERGILLSGGQKQRVAIARAFLKDAPIIILDEATSALDNKAEAVVQMAIDNLMKDKTVFVIAHRLSTIQNANKIIVINQGEIVEQGTHKELLQIENGAYKTLYEMQFKKQENSKEEIKEIKQPA